MQRRSVNIEGPKQEYLPGGTIYDSRPKSILQDVLDFNVRTIQGDYTIHSRDDWRIRADTTNGDIAITLPLVTGETKLRTFHVKKLVAANTVTIYPVAGQLIDGAVSFAITIQYANYEFGPYWDGESGMWEIL